MIVLVLIGIVVSMYYYESVNSSYDPRVVGARKLYARYDALAQEQDMKALLSLLDSIETIYTGLEQYDRSYEVGVLYNNRTAIFLTVVLQRMTIGDVSDSFRSLSTDSLLNLAEEAVNRSIKIYQEWMERFDGITKGEIDQQIGKDFLSGLENFSMKEQQRFLNRRIEEIVTAQRETPRRLSVSYTNLGIIYRHREDFQMAAEYYQKAMSLWEDNLTAKNNLNILMGRPLEERNLFQKLFPPEKDN